MLLSTLLLNAATGAAVTLSARPSPPRSEELQCSRNGFTSDELPFDKSPKNKKNLLMRPDIDHAEDGGSLGFSTLRKSEEEVSQGTSSSKGSGKAKGKGKGKPPGPAPPAPPTKGLGKGKIGTTQPVPISQQRRLEGSSFGRASLPALPKDCTTAKPESEVRAILAKVTSVQSCDSMFVETVQRCTPERGPAQTRVKHEVFDHVIRCYQQFPQYMRPTEVSKEAFYGTVVRNLFQDGQLLQYRGRMNSEFPELSDPENVPGDVSPEELQKLQAEIGYFTYSDFLRESQKLIKQLGESVDAAGEKIVLFLPKNNYGGATTVCAAGEHEGKTYSNLLCKSSMWVTVNLWNFLKAATSGTGGFDVYLPAANDWKLLRPNDVFVNLLDASYSGDEAQKTVLNYLGQERPGRYVIVSPVASSIAQNVVQGAIDKKGANEKVKFLTGDVWTAPENQVLAESDVEHAHFVVEWKAPDRKSIGDIESICKQALPHGSPYSRHHGQMKARDLSGLLPPTGRSTHSLVRPSDEDQPSLKKKRPASVSATSEEPVPGTFVTKTSEMVASLFGAVIGAVTGSTRPTNANRRRALERRKPRSAPY